MFITFEGIEGSGKSTQMRLLAERLTSLDREPRLTREPGGSRLGVELRRILLAMESRDVVPRAELFLYLADRAQHVATVIRPALAEGRIVISDRFADSTVVYQGYGRGLDPALLRQLNDVAVDGLWPDLTLLLDLPVETGLSRALARNVRDGKTVAEGRFEAEHLDFHTRVREGYLTWAALNKERWIVVDAAREPEAIATDVFKAVALRLEGRG